MKHLHSNLQLHLLIKKHNNIFTNIIYIDTQHFISAEKIFILIAFFENLKHLLAFYFILIYKSNLEKVFYITFAKLLCTKRRSGDSNGIYVPMFIVALPEGSSASQKIMLLFIPPLQYLKKISLIQNRTKCEVHTMI